MGQRLLGHPGDAPLCAAAPVIPRHSLISPGCVLQLMCLHLLPQHAPLDLILSTSSRLMGMHAASQLTASFITAQQRTSIHHGH